MVGVIFWCRMKPKVVQYSPTYYGIMLTDRQLRLLCRIATDQALPVRVVIERCLQKGFANTERYSFTHVTK